MMFILKNCYLRKFWRENLLRTRLEEISQDRPLILSSHLHDFFVKEDPGVIEREPILGLTQYTWTEEKLSSLIGFASR